MHLIGIDPDPLAFSQHNPPVLHIDLYGIVPHEYEFHLKMPVPFDLSLTIFFYFIIKKQNRRPQRFVLYYRPSGIIRTDVCISYKFHSENILIFFENFLLYHSTCLAIYFNSTKLLPLCQFAANFCLPINYFSIIKKCHGKVVFPPLKPDGETRKGRRSYSSIC